jgi:HAD superfamily hydrolase (TIGR01549 family)
MIKAVFFDWFNTLARYEPAREETASRVLREFGFDATVERVRQAIAAADKSWFEENTLSPVRKRSAEEQKKVYVRYQQTVLHEVGVDVVSQPRLLGEVMGRMQALSEDVHFVLFDDVVPTLKSLKERNLRNCILTNLDQDMTPLLSGLGIDSCIDLFVTSAEVGADKPSPLLFLEALKRASILPAEAVHVGDQYGVDVVGARGVGINPILLDRFDTSADVTDCPRIRSLSELVGYLS